MIAQRRFRGENDAGVISAALAKGRRPFRWRDLLRFDALFSRCDDKIPPAVKLAGGHTVRCSSGLGRGADGQRVG
jgi:hypothetical protein